jgi:hypothetical protein
MNTEQAKKLIIKWFKKNYSSKVFKSWSNISRYNFQVEDMIELVIYADKQRKSNKKLNKMDTTIGEMENKTKVSKTQKPANCGYTVL